MVAPGMRIIPLSPGWNRNKNVHELKYMYTAYKWKLQEKKLIKMKQFIVIKLITKVLERFHRPTIMSFIVLYCVMML